MQSARAACRTGLSGLTMLARLSHDSLVHVYRTRWCMYIERVCIYLLRRHGVKEWNKARN